MKIHHTNYVRIDWIDNGNQGVMSLVSAEGEVTRSVITVAGYSRQALGTDLMELLDA